MAKLCDINNYWKEKFYWLDDEPECFLCGDTYHLEKYHLIPHSAGGKNTVDNLVLLCQNHHRQAPNICCNKDIMLNWILTENEKYSLIFNTKLDDLYSIQNSFFTLYSRLSKVFNSKYLNQENIYNFIFNSFEKNTLFLTNHYISNENTKRLYFHYLSTYEDLEKDFSTFLNLK